MSRPYQLAVDLGTCNTVAVVDRGGAMPRALLFDGSPLLPSAVFVDAAGTLHGGRDAERLMVTDPARFEPYPKRRVNEGTVLLGDHEVAVTDLLAGVLRRVVAEAGLAGVHPTGATVLTCPADWGPQRRAVLQQAAAAAGLGPVALLEEPVAAAHYCAQVLGQQVAIGRCAAVFDFGGGTLDVTVVQRDPDGLRVLATGGLDDLGGADVDAALVGHLGHVVSMIAGSAWNRLVNARTTGELRDRRTFWSEVRAAKEMLSRTASAPVQVPGTDHSVHLTRDELERVAGPLVDRAVDETRRVLQRSGLDPAQLDAVLLVGGSSRLPMVATRLHARLGIAPVVPEQPELPVALGALLLANASAQVPPRPVPRGAAPLAPAPPAPAPRVPTPLAHAQATPTPLAHARPAPTPLAHALPVPAGRPGVVIGPGVTLVGSVGVYGDADLMPHADEPASPDEPDEPNVPDQRRALRAAAARGAAAGIRRRLRFWFGLLLPFAIIMAVTPWGRDLYTRLTGAGQSAPTVSPAPSTGPRLSVSPPSGPANTRVSLLGHGFQPGEEVNLADNGRQFHTLQAAADGTVTYSFQPGTEKFSTPGPQVLTATGRLSGRAAQTTYQLTAT